MKKTDFDSIKEKFDNSGVNAPDALHEDRIAGMLLQITRSKAARGRKERVSRRSR